MLGNEAVKVSDKVEIDPKKVSHVLLQDLVDGQDEMLEELRKLNKNLAIVGAALIKMAEDNAKMAEKPVKVAKAKT